MNYITTTYITRLSVLQTTSDHFQLVEMYEKEYAVVTSSEIDREQTAIHELVVECHDLGKPSLSTKENLIVHVDDVNDHSPKFSTPVYNTSVRENSQPFEVDNAIQIEKLLCHYKRRITKRLLPPI